MNETDLQRLICRTLRKAGAQAEKIHADQYQRTGISDIIACYRGTYWAIEVKVDRNRPTPAQEMFLREVREAGGYGSWCNNLAAVETALEHWPDVCRYCLAPLTYERLNDVLQCPTGHGVAVEGQWIEFVRGADDGVPRKRKAGGQGLPLTGDPGADRSPRDRP